MFLKSFICVSCVMVSGIVFADKPVTHFDQMVVSASKIQEKNIDAAASVSTIDTQGLKRKQPKSLDDVFKDIPAVEAAQGPRRTAEQVNIRGFGEKRTVLRVDGGRQNLNFAHNGRLFIEPEFLRQVDVLKGSHSSYHGSGALGGVVTLQTLEAADYLDEVRPFGALAKASFGTNAREKMGKAALYGRIDDKADALVAFVGRKTQDVKPGRGARIDYSRDKIKSGMGKINLYVAEHHHIVASLVHFDDDHPTLSSPNLDKVTKLGLQNLAELSTFPVDRDTRQTMGAVAYHFASPDTQLVDVTARFYGSVTKIDDSIRKDFSTTLTRNDASKLTTRGVDFYNISHISTGLTWLNFDWLYGLEAYRDHQVGTRNGLARSQFPRAKLTNEGYYTRLDVKMDCVTLSPGYRRDQVETKKRDSLPLKRSYHKSSPSFSAKIEPVEWLMVYGLYAQGFRAASLSELYGTGIHFLAPLMARNGRPVLINRRMVIVPNLFVANPDLRPEIAKTYETGFALKFDDVLMGQDHLRFKTAFFKTRATDFIEQNVDFANFVTTLSNVQSARISGYEAEMLYDTKTVFAGFGFSAIKGTDQTAHEPLATIPAHKVSTLLGTKLPACGVELGWRAMMHRKQNRVPLRQTEIKPTAKTPGYATHDVFMNWVPETSWGKYVEFNVGVDNVTNKFYRKHLAYLPSPGRNVKFGLTSKF